MNELEDTLLLNQNRLHFASKSILGERRSQQDAIGVVARDEETTLAVSWLRWSRLILFLVIL